MASVLNPSAGPFNGRILNDSAYSITASVVTSLPGSASFNFVQASPFPTIEKATLSLTLSPSGTNTASLTLQHSADNTTFANIPQFAAPLVKTGASTLSSSVVVILPPDVKQYLRVSGSGATADSYQAQVNF